MAVNPIRGAMVVPAISLVLSLLSALAAHQVSANPSGDPLVVEAWLSTAGPYGDVWSAKLAADGRLQLQVLRTSGEVNGVFQLTGIQMANLRSVIHAQSFFKLPAQITPTTVALHEPDFRLEVKSGGHVHKVALYSPEDLAKDINARRFLEVWKAVFAPLPVKPAW